MAVPNGEPQSRPGTAQTALWTSSPSLLAPQLQGGAGRRGEQPVAMSRKRTEHPLPPPCLTWGVSIRPLPCESYVGFLLVLKA